MRTRMRTTKTLFGWVGCAKLFSVLFSQGAVTLCTVRATAAKPVLMRVSHMVETAYNAGTTNTLKFGNSTSDVAYSADLIAGVDFIEKIIRTDTTLVATYGQTGTAATVGRSDIVIELTPLG